MVPVPVLRGTMVEAAQGKKGKGDKMKIKFPVIKNAVGVYPAVGNRCPVCGEPLATENKVEQVILSFGAMRKVGKNSYTGINDDLRGFMYLSTHNHGHGKHVDAELDVVDMSHSGQADLMFCSFNCAKDFLCKAVDELEAISNKLNK